MRPLLIGGQVRDSEAYFERMDPVGGGVTIAPQDAGDVVGALIDHPAVRTLTWVRWAI